MKIACRQNNAKHKAIRILMVIAIRILMVMAIKILMVMAIRILMNMAIKILMTCLYNWLPVLALSVLGLLV